MSFAIAPLETYAAEGITGLVISAPAKGDAATIVKRATAVLSIVTAIEAIQAGNTVTGLNSLNSALATSSLDPGEALALQGVLSQLVTQAGLFNSILGATISGQIANTVVTNVLTGVTNAAQAEIAKYSPPAVTSSPQPGIPTPVVTST